MDPVNRFVQLPHTQDQEAAFKLPQPQEQQAAFKLPEDLQSRDQQIEDNPSNGVLVIDDGTNEMDGSNDNGSNEVGSKGDDEVLLSNGLCKRHVVMTNVTEREEEMTCRHQEEERCAEVVKTIYVPMKVKLIGLDRTVNQATTSTEIFNRALDNFSKTCWSVKIEYCCNSFAYIAWTNNTGHKR